VQTVTQHDDRIAPNFQLKYPCHAQVLGLLLVLRLEICGLLLKNVAQALCIALQST
jgi:hypothetical protein